MEMEGRASGLQAERRAMIEERSRSAKALALQRTVVQEQFKKCARRRAHNHHRAHRVHPYRPPRTPRTPRKPRARRARRACRACLMPCVPRVPRTRRARSMGDLNKSKDMLAQMGIDVEQLKEMSESIMNASGTSIAAPNQKSTTSMGGGAHITCTAHATRPVQSGSGHQAAA